VLVAVLLDLQLSNDLGLLFDVAFVLVCIGAALAVRPQDFFMVGVFPPLLMAATVGLLAVLARGSVAEGTDGLLQAVVSGLAHHARALVAGYGLTLALLALRQVAIRNAGRIRAHTKSGESGESGTSRAGRPARSSAHSPR
jgi:hypothetical protein